MAKRQLAYIFASADVAGVDHGYCQRARHRWNGANTFILPLTRRSNASEGVKALRGLLLHLLQGLFAIVTFDVRAILLRNTQLLYNLPIIACSFLPG